MCELIMAILYVKYTFGATNPKLLTPKLSKK